MAQPTEYQFHPTWWTEQHNSTWDRVKEALRRDWEQTKSDLSMPTGRDLHQGAVDTILQAIGREPLPLPHQPNPQQPQRNWQEHESAVRYGYGAGTQYPEHTSWSEELEGRLSKEWTELSNGLSWESIKHAVRHGWDEARRRLTSDGDAHKTS